MPPKTTKTSLHWDRGDGNDDLRIAKKKILFIRKISMRNNGNICRQTIMSEFMLNIKGKWY